MRWKIRKVLIAKEVKFKAEIGEAFGFGSCLHFLCDLAFPVTLQLRFASVNA
jgi:hypothetical protein